ncbi:hypothetical protein [Streptomyces mirabilis]|uniref:hypothetical protein n=1 Tax=Streptomyces mirabilis TaxID=68239 RepID=UPI003330B448
MTTRAPTASGRAPPSGSSNPSRGSTRSGTATDCPRRESSFHIGARCDPGVEDLDAGIATTRAKISAGARFLVTRPVFETAGPCLLGAPGGDRVPVLVAVSVLSGFAEAEYMAYEVPGAHIPQDALTALDTAGERARETGARLAADLLTEVRPLVDGVVVVFRDDKGTAGVLSGARRA